MTATDPNPAGRFTLPAYMRQQSYRRALLLALGFAVAWWLIVLRIREVTGLMLFADQYLDFTQLGLHLGQPYEVTRFVNVPWTALFLAPFSLPPFEFAVLMQVILYFCLLATVVFKFGGNLWTVLVVFLSPLAFDATMELNVDWVVVIGLLVPREWSGVFFLVKPQVLFGSWFGFEWREIVRAVLILLVVLVISFAVLPGWPQAMADNVMSNTLGDVGNRVNIAMSKGLPIVFSYGIGVVLAVWAFRRKDVFLGVVAWQFLVPYMTFYGLLPVFALIAVRRPRIAVLISLVFWVPFSKVLFPFLF